MNPLKNTEFLHGLPKDEEYQLTFLLDRPLRLAVPVSSANSTEVAEHILHLPPADERS